jgi:DNA polymerase I-like protein with 3'-5' exonuclease and polymerase domains
MPNRLVPVLIPVSILFAAGVYLTSCGPKVVAVDAAIRQGKLPARLMMSCHDEIGVSMHPDEVVKAQILREYTDFGPEAPRVRMRVPIQASADYGANWYEASKG